MTGIGDVPVGVRTSDFVNHVKKLDSVEKVEKEVIDGDHYWKVYPTESFIPAEVSKALGDRGLGATPDGDGLLVQAGAVLFTGDSLDLIRESVKSVQRREEQDPAQVAAQAAKLAESDEFDADDEFESVSETLEFIADTDELMRILFFKDGEPIFDPDDEDMDFIALQWPESDDR